MSLPEWPPLQPPRLPNQFSVPGPGSRVSPHGDAVAFAFQTTRITLVPKATEENCTLPRLKSALRDSEPLPKTRHQREKSHARQTLPPVVEQQQQQQQQQYVDVEHPKGTSPSSLEHTVTPRRASPQHLPPPRRLKPLRDIKKERSDSTRRIVPKRQEQPSLRKTLSNNEHLLDLIQELELLQPTPPITPPTEALSTRLRRPSSVRKDEGAQKETEVERIERTFEQKNLSTTPITLDEFNEYLAVLQAHEKHIKQMSSNPGYKGPKAAVTKKRLLILKIAALKLNEQIKFHQGKGGIYKDQLDQTITFLSKLSGDSMYAFDFRNMRAQFSALQRDLPQRPTTHPKVDLGTTINPHRIKDIGNGALGDYTIRDTDGLAIKSSDPLLKELRALNAPWNTAVHKPTSRSKPLPTEQRLDHVRQKVAARQSVEGDFDELLPTHNTTLDSFLSIIRDGEFDTDRCVYFRLGCDCEYGPIQFVMKKGFEDKVSEDGSLVTITDFEDRRGVAYDVEAGQFSLNQLRERSARESDFHHHLEEHHPFTAPSTGTFEVSRTVYHRHAQNPQLEVQGKVGLDQVQAILVPDHLYDKVMATIEAHKATTPALASIKVIRINTSGGTSSETDEPENFTSYSFVDEDRKDKGNEEFEALRKSRNPQDAGSVRPFPHMSAEGFHKSYLPDYQEAYFDLCIDSGCVAAHHSVTQDSALREYLEVQPSTRHVLTTEDLTTPDGHVLEQNFVETSAGFINTLSYGPEDGPEVYFFHGDGKTSTWRDYKGYVDDLVSRGYKVVLMDMPGKGDSDGEGYIDEPSMSKAFPELIQGLRKLPSFQYTGKVSLQGNSKGGSRAYQCALDHPDLISGLALTNPIFSQKILENPDKRTLDASIPILFRWNEDSLHPVKTMHETLHFLGYKGKVDLSAESPDKPYQSQLQKLTPTLTFRFHDYKSCEVFPDKDAPPEYYELYQYQQICDMHEQPVLSHRKGELYTSCKMLSPIGIQDLCSILPSPLSSLA